MSCLSPAQQPVKKASYPSKKTNGDILLFQKALKNASSLKKHLKTHHVDSTDPDNGYMLFHLAVNELKKAQSDKKRAVELPDHLLKKVESL